MLKTREEISHLRTSPYKLLSYSSLNSFNSCPRKYQLQKAALLQKDLERPRQASQNLAYGSAFGEGLQELVCSGSLEKAVLRAAEFYDYGYIYALNKKRKSLFDCIGQLEQFAKNNLEELGQDWEMLTLEDGTPAREVAFILDFGQGMYYRGFIDFILKHKTSDAILVVEIKTTGNYESASQFPGIEYSNSPQGTVYCAVATHIAHTLGFKSEPGVAYIVNRTRAQTIRPYIFRKPPELLCRCLQDIAWESDILAKQITREGLWAKTGNGCNWCGFAENCEVSVDVGDGTVPVVEGRLEKAYFIDAQELIRELCGGGGVAGLTDC